MFFVNKIKFNNVIINNSFKGINNYKDLKQNTVDIYKLQRQQDDEINQFKTTPNNALLSKISKNLNLPVDNVVSLSPIRFKISTMIMNQGVSVYHHELRKVITPHDDYERAKRRELVEKIEAEQMKKDMKSNEKGDGNKGGGKKLMSMEKEFELVREQEREQSHFNQLLESQSPQWNAIGQLQIPKEDAFYYDDLFVGFCPYSSDGNKDDPMSLLYQMLTRLSKFYWHKNQTKYEMFFTLKLNQMFINYFMQDETLIYNPQEISKFIELFENCNDQSVLNELIQHPESVENQEIVNYVKMNFGRLSSENYSVIFETLFRDGKDYFSSVESYKQHLLSLFNEILFSATAMLPETIINKEKELKEKWDLLLLEANRQFKVYSCFGTSPEPEKSLATDQRKLLHLVKTCQKKSTLDFIQECKRNLHQSLFSNGLMNSSLTNRELSVSIKQITDGLQTSISTSYTMLEFVFQNSGEISLKWDDFIVGFINSPMIFSSQPLAERFMQYLKSRLGGDGNSTYEQGIVKLFQEMVQLEHTLFKLQQSYNDDYIINGDKLLQELSIELQEELQEEDYKKFLVYPSSNYKMVQLDCHLLAPLHKSFSQDLDVEQQEMEIYIRNKKIYERELKTRNEKLVKLVSDAVSTQQKTCYFIGVFEDQAYTVEISENWMDIWYKLKAHPSPIPLLEFLNSNLTSQDTIKNTLFDLNKFGILYLLHRV
ncbi:tortoise [Tieghemostelium lacteum]|uniref:Tortoise n=1 Tax=Tieghemostelium lacteum TaxID=361077 RepID=A0A151Z3L3_TIELA|nr:tortoise [Tieghemostelium lacteum]|eukprot:KYQ88539.1 tortoise [Tieghemostelium lacteum]